MKRIRVENYRAIADSGMIELKPITIAVGKNSAGKSSFIRLFPLLKQTLEKRTAEPLLWYGDYVDFGDFHNTVSNTNRGEPIKISFEVDPNAARRPISWRAFSQEISAITVTLSIKEKYISTIDIGFKNQEVEITINGKNEAEIIINGDSSVFESEAVFVHSAVGDIIPNLYQKKEINKERFISKLETENLVQKCEQYFFNRKIRKGDRRWEPYCIDKGIYLGSQEEMLETFKRISKEKFENKKIDNKYFMRYNNYIIAISLPNIIDLINECIWEDMNQTRYVKPIRAMVNRYYRVQGVSINELDADGSNLPMILKNMSASQRQLHEFESWSKEAFGIVFSVKETEGHISLIVKNDVKSKTGINVADTGYGYSQMLPIVMLLWMTHARKLRSTRHMPQTVVIEQPELHLHPAYQARMMDVFVSLVTEAKKQGTDLKIIFETHSETMINRLGLLVAHGKISKEDINILVFDKQQSTTNICSKGYDDDGVLRGWPMDFFAPEDIG